MVLSEVKVQVPPPAKVTGTLLSQSNTHTYKKNFIMICTNNEFVRPVAARTQPAEPAYCPLSCEFHPKTANPIPS